MFITTVWISLCAFGFLLNLRFGLRPSHYSIILVSALFTSFVSLRQVALHVIPDTGVYGSAIFGMHLYTWSFIISMLIVLATSIMLGIDRQYSRAHVNASKGSVLIHGLYALLILLVLANLVSVFLECGLSQCPDNPVRYLFL